MPASTDFAAISDLHPYDKLTVIPLYHDHALPLDTDRVRYRAPSVFAWHEEFGRQVHRDLEMLTWRIASTINKSQSDLAGAPTALSFLLLDGVLWQYLLLRRVLKLLEESSDDPVFVLYLKDKILEQAVKTALLHANITHKRRMISRTVAEPNTETKDAQPPIIIKPSLTENISRICHRLDKLMWRQYRNFQRRRYPGTFENISRAILALKPAPTLREKIATLLSDLDIRSSKEPLAIVCWNCRDRNYMKALLRVLFELLERRPVLLLFEGKADEIIPEILKLESARTNKVYMLSIDEIAKLAYGHAENAKAHAESVMDAAASDPELGSADIAILKHSTATYIRENGTVPIFAAIMILVNELDDIPIAYGLFASGRASFYAAIAEQLAKRAVPTSDVHIYLVGNHARQIPPPTNYAAVIDDQQEALVSSFWGWSASRCIRVGYLWREQAVGVDNTMLARDTPATIIICTQPGETEMVKGFFQDVLSTLSTLKPAEIIVKPHPAEVSAVIAFYKKLIANHPLASQFSVKEGKDSLTGILQDADIVITRTSNAGIEAALMGKPVVRYLAYDKYDRSVEHVVSYANTVWTIEELQLNLGQLVDNAQIRGEQIAAQNPYLDANPAQVMADGPTRLVEFMESRIKERANTSEGQQLYG